MLSLTIVPYIVLCQSTQNYRIVQSFGFGCNHFSPFRLLPFPIFEFCNEFNLHFRVCASIWMNIMCSFILLFVYMYVCVRMTKGGVGCGIERKHSTFAILSAFCSPMCAYLSSTLNKSIHMHYFSVSLDYETTFCISFDRNI